MLNVNALQMRQSFGKILKKLQKRNEPIIVEKGRKAVAVLISLKTFQERFIDYREQKKREELIRCFANAAIAPAEDSLAVLHDLRYGENH